MQNLDLRYLWCDGFTPERYLLHGSEPRITGRAWICHGTRQDEWKFTLFLPQPVKSRDEFVEEYWAAWQRGLARAGRGFGADSA